MIALKDRLNETLRDANGSFKNNPKALKEVIKEILNCKNENDYTKVVEVFNANLIKNKCK